MILKSLPLVTTVSLAFAYPVSAQVIPDNSLGSESSIVTPNVTVKDAIADFIEGGAVRGNNLFHSFSEFNVGNGGSVYFANPDGVTNILNRVTGNNASNIFGTLGVDGGANLFLLNPNGILFGENAALDVSGSFFATTADSYIFDNGIKYSASNPDLPPLLTIDLPVGVQMGNNPGSITVQGAGHNLALDPFTFAPIRDNRPVGLEVESGNTLMLLGGEVNLNGGNLTAFQGRVELGSVGATETVGLNPTNDGFTVEYDQINNFSEINLTKAASIEVSGSGGGNIQIRGNNISVVENSAIIANTLGTDNGGDIGLTASESIEVITTEGEFPGSILSQVELGAIGDGGNLTIDAKDLEITGRISTSTFGAGNSGDLTVNAESIEIKKASQSILTGLYSTVAFPSATGKGGNVIVESDRIVLEDGGQIASGTFGIGNSGDLSVDAESIEIRGAASPGVFSGLFSTVAFPSATGKGGNLTVESGNIILEDGGRIASGTFGAGNSGDLTVDAESIEIRGVASPGDLSGLFSTVAPEATGKGGNLTVESGNIILEDGGQITSGTFGTGNSGDLSVSAESIEIRGITPQGDFSGLFSTVGSLEATGDGGNLMVNSNSIILEDGGRIASGTFGAGNSGDLSVNVESIELKKASPQGLPTGLFSTVAPEATGRGGNLTVESGNIILEDGGQIASGTFGIGNSGDLTVDAESIEIKKASQGVPTGLFSTVAFLSATGDGGNLTVESDRLILEDGGQIGSGSLGIGNSGDLSIKASNSIKIDGITSLTNLEENQILPSSLFASVENTGTGDGGNLTVKTPQLQVTNGGQIRVSTSGQGNGGNLTIESNNLHLLSGGQISASSFGLGNAGNIKIQANNIELLGVLPNESVLDIEQESLPSSISAFSQGEFAAGSITIESNNLNLSDRGNISVSNLDTGNSGNLYITANELNLDRSATIEARVNAGDRGNINLTTDNITLDDRSQITVQATGTATGGNITIDNSNLILARNNSDIKANAEFGSGGNISILTELIFTDLTSDIDASSEFGLDGVVEVKSPDSEKELGEVVLPENITDLSSLITVTCSANDNNAVAVIGNGGIPESPYQTQSIDTTWNDLRPVKQETAQVAALPKPLTEANSTVIDKDGELELVALTPLPVHRWIDRCSN